MLILDAAVVVAVLLAGLFLIDKYLRPNKQPRALRRQTESEIEHHRRCIRVLNRLYVYDEMCALFPNDDTRAEVARLIDQPPKEITP